MRHGRGVTSEIWAAGLLVATASAVFAQAPGAVPAVSPIGRWLRASGNGVVEIYPCDRRLWGRVVWVRKLVDDQGRPLADRNNPDPALKTRPACGLPIMGGFEFGGPREWGGGWVYNPENGKTYRARLTLENETVLRLRGYIGIPLFGETQVWTRADPSLDNCGAG